MHPTFTPSDEPTGSSRRDMLKKLSLGSAAGMFGLLTLPAEARQAPTTPAYA